MMRKILLGLLSILTFTSSCYADITLRDFIASMVVLGNNQDAVQPYVFFSLPVSQQKRLFTTKVPALASHSDSIRTHLEEIVDVELIRCIKERGDASLESATSSTIADIIKGLDDTGVPLALSSHIRVDALTKSVAREVAQLFLKAHEKFVQLKGSGWWEKTVDLSKLSPSESLKFQRNGLLIAALNKRFDLGLDNEIAHLGFDFNQLLFDTIGSIKFDEMNDLFMTIDLAKAAGVSLEKKNNTGETALLAAASALGDEAELLQKLIDVGADKEAQDNDGKTPLMGAVTNQNFKKAAALLSAKVNINAKDHNGDTALMLVAKRPERLKGTKFLLQHGADKEIKNNRGETALYQAAFYGKVEQLQELINAGADKEARDNNGDTPLIAALWDSNRIENAAALLNAGANINAQGMDRNTPLILAVHLHLPQAVKMLLDHNPDQTLRNDEKETAYDLAVRRGYKDIIALFDQKNKVNKNK
jgi:ankyrin repeat protein